MNFPIPDFVPVPSAEIMQTISIISLIIGICLVGAGLLFLFLNKKKGKEKKELLKSLFKKKKKRKKEKYFILI